MPAQFETLESKLLRLPTDRRERLANVLLDSLPGFVGHEFSERQLSEFARRSKEVSEGAADLVSYNEVMAEVEIALRQA